VLRVIADEAGLPPSAGGCFVSGGSAGNLSALAVARETAKHRTGRSGRFRAIVGTDAHSSIVNTLRLLEMDALVVPTPGTSSPAMRCGPRWTKRATCRMSRP
jgi:glutamate/tyrosine decarboxylase-like PLP-dependent enzyme